MDGCRENIFGPNQPWRSFSGHVNLNTLCLFVGDPKYMGRDKKVEKWKRAEQLLVSYAMMIVEDAFKDVHFDQKEKGPVWVCTAIKLIICYLFDFVLSFDFPTNILTWFSH